MVSCCGPARVQRPTTSWAGRSHSPLEITPHKARVKLGVLVITVVALFEPRAERGGTTGADVPEYFALAG
jgi:hypothetical protein